MSRTTIKNLCVYCGSALGESKEYADAAFLLGKELAARKIGLVYGGGSVGLMGVVANSVLEHGGEVTGVIPRQFEREVVHENLTRIIYTDSMSERKLSMLALSDAFVALAGGYGTFDEITEALVLLQLGAFDKPCGFLNTRDFYGKFFNFLDHVEREGFLMKIHRDMAIFKENPSELIDALYSYDRPAEKLWWNENLEKPHV